jgi:HEPN domain-containing protein
MDEAKRDEIQQWLAKAQRDLNAARILLEHDEPYLDITVYHCQQAVEKALKAYLTYKSVFFQKTHNLVVLLVLCVPFDEGFSEWRTVAITLTPYAVDYRYPGDVLQPEQTEAEFAVESAAAFINFVRSVLPDELER